MTLSTASGTSLPAPRKRKRWRSISNTLAIFLALAAVLVAGCCSRTRMALLPDPPHTRALVEWTSPKTGRTYRLPAEYRRKLETGTLTKVDVAVVRDLMERDSYPRRARVMNGMAP